MTLPMWVFTISVVLLALLTILEVVAARRTERPHYMRKLSYGSDLFERLWLKTTNAIETLGFVIVRQIIHALEWLFSHGIQTLFEVFRTLSLRIAKLARSRGVIKKRGASSLFLKQISEHKRQHQGGEIEG